MVRHLPRFLPSQSRERETGTKNAPQSGAHGKAHTGFEPVPPP
jgi:hypothetical protein